MGSMKIPNIDRKQFKPIFLLHFMLLAFAMMAWAPGGYLFTNVIFLGCFLWSLSQPSSSEPVSLGLVINLFCILFDIVILGIFFPRVFNLLLRFFSSFVLYNEWLGRGEPKQEAAHYSQ